MLDPKRQTILYDQNAIYYGYPIEKLMEKAGKGISKELVKKFGKNKKIAFVCGPGNNGVDLMKNKTGKPEVFLIPDYTEIKTAEATKNWIQYKGHKQDNVSVRDIPNKFDIVVECLFGTGIEGKLIKPYKAIVRKLNRMKGKNVTIDLPAPGFKPDYNISMMFPKEKGAAVVDIGFPKNIAESIGVGEVKVLKHPGEKSHKGDNGKLLIIGGSEKFHGAPILAAKAASRLVDLVYFSSTPENNKLIQHMKSKLADFIAVPRKFALKQAKDVDIILIGPGIGESKETEELTNELLKNYPDKKIILDADSLKMADSKLLNKNCIVTPHKKEFKALFGLKATQKNVKKMAKKHKCTIVLKGQKDMVCDAEQCKFNTTGNPGMTKGGTGDVLAGLIAALACTNELYLAASAGVFINGLAGDRLETRMSYIFNATDLVEEIPETVKWCMDY